MEILRIIWIFVDNSFDSQFTSYSTTYSSSIQHYNDTTTKPGVFLHICRKLYLPLSYFLCVSLTSALACGNQPQNHQPRQQQSKGWWQQAPRASMSHLSSQASLFLLPKYYMQRKSKINSIWPIVSKRNNQIGYKHVNILNYNWMSFIPSCGLHRYKKNIPTNWSAAVFCVCLWTENFRN